MRCPRHSRPAPADYKWWTPQTTDRDPTAIAMTTGRARSPSSAGAIVLALLLLSCFAAARVQSQRKPSISYASAGGRSLECLRTDPPPFCRGVSAITGEHTAGRIMADTDNDKINLPDGLCVHVDESQCSVYGDCFCCLPIQYCYPTMEKCKRKCTS